MKEPAEFLNNFPEAKARLGRAIKSADIPALAISDYVKRNLSAFATNFDHHASVYENLLSWSFRGLEVDPSKAVFIDYGGGCGSLSLLAKAGGIGTVIFCDIYDVATRDAERIGRALGLPADHYLCGDSDGLVSCLSKKGLAYDAAASFDVIEHVYDAGKMLRLLARAGKARCNMAMATTANIENPIIRSDRMRFQRQVETSDRGAEWGRRERDSLRAYRDVRLEIIRRTAGNLTAAEAELLAKRTRGLTEPDIIEAASIYKDRGRMPIPPAHPTNTCDPLTGNWAERLMPPDELEAVLEREGFRARIVPGKYTLHSQAIVKNLLKSLTNAAIDRLGRRGMTMAPYFILWGSRR